MALRFYLDENIPLVVAAQLQRRGIEVVSARSLDRLGDDDVDHLHRATRMGYVLCTYDTDFVQLAAQVQHAGVTIGQPEKHWVGEWVLGLEPYDAAYVPEEMHNRVDFL